MKKLRRLAALLLCVLMMIPSQGLAVLAETEGQITDIPLETDMEAGVPEAVERISETLPLEMIKGAERISEMLPLEMIEGAEDETSRIEETLALEPMKKDTSDKEIIYWNPGGMLPEDLATASNAQTATASNARKATASNARKGSDDADGRTPSTPVKTLAKAIARAEELMAEEGLLPADITIYAMNPMEVADGQLYALNGGNLSIQSWPGRSYDSDVIFYVNGGQLTMMNARLASGNGERADDEARLIYVRGGAFQMGQNVNLEGRVVLDYRSGTEEKEWETATASDAAADVRATGSDAAEGEGSFDLNEYILDNDEDSMELIEDSVSASTWRDPIIELLDGFDGGAGEYLLELLEDGSAEEIELVKTLYSDAETEEDFLGFFTLTENTDASWSLQVETQAAAQVRNTSLLSTLSVAEVLTSKTLVAARAGGNTIYWNPGGNIVIGGTTYYAGDDVNFSGSTAQFPVKTWENAMALAQGGTVICMQTLDLGGSNADAYLLTKDGAGNYLLKSSSTATMVALSAWSTNPQPAIRVPAGKTLALQDVELVGVNGTSAQAIVCDTGDLIIQENVIAETGYIQITAFKEMQEHPVKVTSTDTGMITLFFSGINSSYDYCYTDVVVPYGDLADSITNAGDSEAVAAQAESVGLALLSCFQLHSSHRDAVNGGTSRFDWVLRQDTAEDDNIVNAQNLELYAVYYFDAVYLNGVNGDDSYYGATCQYPVKTWARAQERWAYEMKKSVDARRAASAADRSAAYIEEFYPMPKTIYICGTVTVDGSQEWDQYLGLDPQYRVDYDGSTIVTEVVPHMDIPYKEDGATLNHEIPVTLVKVTDGGDLKIKDVTFRNITDNAESVTIQVEGSGSLALKGKTLLTGERLAKGSITAKAVTLGTHVKVLSGGSFVMDENWEGAIEKRQHGVNASGSGTKVTMNGGSIRENNSFEQDIYTAGQTSHKRGAGVLLSDKAEFTMDGGEITGNTVYQYGAGVYMVDEGTSFVMNKGTISGNKMYIGRTSGSSTTGLRGYGIGIYAGTGTVLKIGNGTNPAEEVLITGNKGYLADGVGIWSDGELTMDQATIAENFAGGYSTSYSTTSVSYGIGIYVGGNGKLTMGGGQITGNYSTNANGGYGNAFGAGIYFASSSLLTSHTIAAGSIIKENIVSNVYSTSTSYSTGGGIYMTGSTLNLRITDSEVSENQATNGGGIYISSSSSSTDVTIGNTVIQKNKGCHSNNATGAGGGIYFTGYGSLNLLDGVEIIDNYAGTSGGGIYLSGSSYSGSNLYMKATTPGAISINGNEAASNYGGGIYHTSSTIYTQNAEINSNKATTGGGIYVGSTTRGYFKNVMIDGNQATNGGGLYLVSSSTSTTYNYCMNDCVVTNNTAQGSGGGIYIATGLLHLTESDTGKFALNGNHADNGGGLYAAGSTSSVTSTFYMDIAGEIQNSAASQGSNLYLGPTTSYILAGNFKQPAAADRVSGTYNIYVDDTGTGSTRKYFDMSSVTAEKKDDSDPEVIYLNTANSYLTYLASPPDNTAKTFPIDLNKEVFKVGSVVVKPANTSSVSLRKPNDNVNGVATYTKTYTALKDATTNLSYFSGGKLPRRTLLGEFADSVTTGLTNITLVGEGVYLSGAGDDNKDGTSPAKAVKTFAVAKERLKENIEAHEDEDEGFSPFIYICGQVNVGSGEPDWELDYDANLFTVTNQNYAIAEDANGAPVYPAQVRRFASFVSAPMIQVAAGSTGSPVTFQAGKIIIDGMADAVITADQSNKSPVIRSSLNSIVTLTGESRITNNYYSGVDIYGTLILTGEEDEPNEQLYNHHGYFVLLYASAKLQMSGYARILADDTVEKINSTAYAIYAQAAGASISMEGHSAIEQGSNSGLMSDGVIYSTYENTSIVMQDEACILNAGSAVTNGVYLAGTNSMLEMRNNANITDTSTYIRYGVRIAGTGISVLMEDAAEIMQAGTHTSTTTIYGIHITGTSPQVTMKGTAGIKYDMPTSSSYRYGIYISATSPRVDLQDDASIAGSDGIKLCYGISISGGSDAKILMNRNDGAQEGDSSQIVNTTYGVYIGSVTGLTISMGKKAEISKATSAVCLVGNTTGEDINFEMTGYSKICNSTQGVYFYGSITSPVNILMEENAAIEQNQFGLREYESNTTYGVMKLNLLMKDDSRISGNSNYGIYLGGYQSFTEASSYQKITLEDQAVIGGTGYYSSADGTSGNQYAGIYANSPIQLTMNGTSKISGNGNSNANTSTTANGVYLTRRTDSYYRSGTARITLNDNASICDNRGGVYVYTVSETSYPNYPNTCVIELNGIKEDESLAYPSIQRNTDAVYLGRQGVLRLKGGAILGDTTYSADGRSLDCYGYLELDGRSTVKGLLYMRDGERPITMTCKVDAGSPQEYKLHLVEGFLGHIVVSPDGGTVTDVTDQLPYFNKVSADGLAAAKNIVADAPNLVLLGENNVYLSVNGDDNYTGNSKTTPVRTFKRAKELLEGGEKGGYFTSGANIIIYNSSSSAPGVSVKAGDVDWSFDDGGYVKNEKSGDRWKPLVIRDESFPGVLISVRSGTDYADSVTFKNITIDGGSEAGITLTATTVTTTAGGQMMTVDSGMTAILKDGAVLQNNKASTSSFNTTAATANTLGVYVSGGTLEIDGGTIQGMVRERSGTSTNSGVYYLSSAIYCTGSASYPGKVIMKSGQITGNQVLGEYLSSTSGRCGAVYLQGAYANMEMSGGQITDNTMRLRGAAYAGAIINYQGTLTMSGGTIRDNQGGKGSAIYHYGDSTGGNLILSGGKISGNSINVVGQSYASQGAYSPIYIVNYGMQLKGGAAELQDPIYLESTNGIIKVSGQIYQANRRYRVYLNQGTTATQFKKGSVVVQPDGSNVTDTTPYLSYFDVRTTPYVLDQGRIAQTAGVNQSAVVVAGVKESQCLILMKAVYLDSVKGSASGDGLTPTKAVSTFARAKTIGEAVDSNGTTDSYNHYIIYVSGKATNTAAETWSLPEFAYMCRYTGFAVYSDTSGTATTGNLAYYGPLIEPAFNLTLQDIAIYGRRTIDTVTNNGDSLVHIKSGMEVSVQTGAILADNYNIGSYIGADGLDNLTSKGGAFQVAAGGTLQMDGGVIQNTEAASGSAIYLGASETDQADSGRGRLILTGTPNVSGKVYLGGTGTVTAAYIEADESYHPSSVLQISIRNDHNGRPVIQYPAGVTPGAAELEYYLFDDAIKAMYDVVNRADPNGNILELNMREVIYLDGQNGDDGNDGSTPEKAYKTLQKVFESIGTDENKYGIVVFVVDTVEVPGVGGGPAEIEMMNILVKDTNGNSHYEGHYKDSSGKIDIRGQVYFKRYAQPKGYTGGDPVYDGFAAPTLTETLFDVKNGSTLTMKGIYLDGHSQDADNSNPTLVADEVVAMSPLVTVGEGGILNCLLADGVSNGVSTATQFTNNINGNQKEKEIGKLNDSAIMEGSSAGIELLDGGKCSLQYTEFSNLQLGENVIAGGTDVYSNGDLHVSLYTHFSGTVYLEGLWTADDKTNPVPSRYITVDMYGDPVKTNFQVLLRDSYMGRDVVYYPNITNVEPPSTDIGYYRLEERVKDYFCLNKRSSARYIFELQVPVAVYIDGINGDDGTSLEDAVGRAAGSTPKDPVKSLKRAFELLSTRGGNTIYVAGTVQVSANTEVTGMSYAGTEGTVLLGSTSKVRITRYIQPDFAVASQQEAEAAGYDVADFTGVLLTVKNGAAAGFGSGVYFDGHSEPKTNTDIREYGEEAVVSRYGETEAPMITVESGGTLTLSAGATLQDNNNTYAAGGSIGQDGGAIANSGTVNVNGALFENNKAGKGSVVYQDGTFNLQSKPENLSNHANAFYLTTSNGTDHVLRTAVAIPDEMVFDVDMDHAVKGRPVVRFTDSSAYSPDADAEHEHFTLGSTVPTALFLVESETDDELLELQNWEILKVEVPTGIYLVMSRKGDNDATTKLRGIMADAPAGDLLTAPEYTIVNRGNYDAKVSISGFENKTTDAGIKANPADSMSGLVDLMNLTSREIDALGSTDLYLAVKGLDDPATAGTGFGIAETSLKPYAYAPAAVTADPAVLGTLTSGTSGNFTFIGAVGSGFMEKYLDSGFLIDGFTGAEAQAYMDGTSSTGIINARAKYLLRYKVEIVPSRRESTAASGSTTP